MLRLPVRVFSLYSYLLSCCIDILLETLTPEVLPQAVQLVPFYCLFTIMKRRDIFSRSLSLVHIYLGQEIGFLSSQTPSF